VTVADLDVGLPITRVKIAATGLPIRSARVWGSSTSYRHGFRWHHRSPGQCRAGRLRTSGGALTRCLSSFPPGAPGFPV